MKNIICKLFGHKKSVIWNMENLQGVFCSRCHTWTAKTKRAVMINEQTKENKL